MIYVMRIGLPFRIRRPVTHSAIRTVRSSILSGAAMMSKPRRLQSFLKSDRFHLSHWSKEENLVLYSRPTAFDGIFEHVQIWCRGKMGEVASVRAECVAGWGIAREFIGESELVMDLADVGSRGSHEFTSPEDVELWERRVAEVAPMKCRELTNRVGAGLELKTRDARHAAHEYLALWQAKGERHLRQLMRSRSTEAQIVEAGKLARLPRGTTVELLRFP